MSLTKLDLACFERNSELTVDAVINGLDGEPANLTGLTGDDIRWRLSDKRGGTALVTVDLDGHNLTPESGQTISGDITITDAANGEIRIQFRPPLPASDPDVFKARTRPYWQEIFVNLSEASANQARGRVRIEKSSFDEV